MFSCLAHLGPMDSAWAGQLSDTLDWATKVGMPHTFYPNYHHSGTRAGAVPAQPPIPPEKQPEPQQPSAVSTSMLLAAATLTAGAVPAAAPSFQPGSDKDTWQQQQRTRADASHAGGSLAAPSAAVSRQNGAVPAANGMPSVAGAEMQVQLQNSFLVQALWQKQSLVQEQVLHCQKLQLKQDALVQHRLLQQLHEGQHAINIKALLTAHHQHIGTTLPAFLHPPDAVQQRLTRMLQNPSAHVSSAATQPEKPQHVASTQPENSQHAAASGNLAAHTNGLATAAAPSELPPLHRSSELVTCGAPSVPKGSSAFLANPAANSCAVPMSEALVSAPMLPGQPDSAVVGDRQQHTRGSNGMGKAHADGGDADRGRAPPVVDARHDALQNLHGWQKAVQLNAGRDSEVDREALLSLLHASGGSLQARGHDAGGDGAARQLAM